MARNTTTTPAPQCEDCKHTLSLVRESFRETIFQCLWERCRRYGKGVTVPKAGQ